MATFGFYPSYKFKDHDPILDKIDTLLKDTNTTHKEASEVSRVSQSTLGNWASRKTKRPQFATVAAVVKSLGGEIEITYKGKTIR